MQDSKPDAGARESDATSKETLKDVEANEKSSPSKPSDAAQSNGPSPDGAFDDTKKSNDAGPM